MRLLVDAHIFDDKFQGTRTYLHGLYSSLVKIAPEVEFYFAATDIDHLKQCFGDGDNVHYIRLSSHNKFMRLAIVFPRIVKKYSIDYAHYQYISPLFKSCKEIVTIHDLLFLDFPDYFPISYKIKNKLFFNRSAQRADLLLTVSDYSRQVVAKHFDIKLSNIHITPNAVSDYFLNKQEDSLVQVNIKQKYNLDKFILFVGRCEPRKNHYSLTKAVSELGLLSDGYKLVYIGKKDIPYPEHENLLNSLSETEKNNVLFLEGISNDELVHFYKNCSLFVFPSYAEGFGIPILEAAASGCRCLCSNYTAMNDFQFLGERLFDPSNIDELKQKIRKSLDGRILPLASSEIDDLIAKYNWDSIAADFLRLLKHEFNS